MKTNETTSKYIGAVSTFLIISALIRLPGSFQAYSVARVPLIATWLSLAQFVFVLVTGVGLFCRWRGFWHMAVAWLTLQVAAGLFTHCLTLAGLHTPIPAIPDAAYFVTVLQVLCLWSLFRRVTRASYDGHTASYEGSSGKS
jgi:hypothetical protein